MKLSQDSLKELLRYEPTTGTFVRRVSNSNSVKAGDTAGSKHPAGYHYIRVKGQRYASHRLAFLYMEGKFPPAEVDHINGDPSDNRWENLRPATRKENMRNIKISKRNTSGHTGVYWSKEKRRWRVQIGCAGKKTHIGYYHSKAEAVLARAAAALIWGYHPNHGRVA